MNHGQTEKARSANWKVNEILKALYLTMAALVTVCPWLPAVQLDIIYVSLCVIDTNSQRVSSNISLEGLFQLEGNRIWIEGDPGVGKSILALKLAYEWANGNCPENIKHLILVRLRNIPPDCSNLVDAIIGSLPKCKESPLSRFQIEELLKNSPRGTILILDGWDELSEDHPIYEQIHAIIHSKMLHHVPVIITSRPSAFIRLSHACQLHSKLQIKGFNDEQLETYVKEKAFNDRESAASEVLNFIRRSIFADIIGKVPLMVALFCELAKLNISKDLPLASKSLTRLFKDILEMFKKHFKTKEYRGSVSIDEMLRVLGKIAWEGLYQHTKLVWNLKELLRFYDSGVIELGLRVGILRSESCIIFDRMKENKPLALDEIEENPSNSETLTINFLHKQFQEFLAANYLAITPKPWFIKFQIMRELRKSTTKMREMNFVILFACGLNTKMALDFMDTCSKNDSHDLLMSCFYEYIEASGSGDAAPERRVAKALSSVNNVSVSNSLQEQVLLGMLVYAKKHYIPLTLWLECVGRTPGYVRDVLGEAAPMVTRLCIHHNGVSAFSSPPPATGPFPHLTSLVVQQCDLADGPADSSAVLEDLLHCCLTHAPRLQRIWFINCTNVPEMIRESNAPLRKLLLSKKDVKVRRGTIVSMQEYLDHTTCHWISKEVYWLKRFQQR